jgi:hypothetical protein
MVQSLLKIAEETKWYNHIIGGSLGHTSHALPGNNILSKAEYTNTQQDLPI